MNLLKTWGSWLVLSCLYGLGQTGQLSAWDVIGNGLVSGVIVGLHAGWGWLCRRLEPVPPAEPVRQEEEDGGEGCRVTGPPHDGCLILVEQAFAWDCPACCVGNWGKPDPAEITEEMRANNPELEKAETGDYLALPTVVECASCGRSWNVANPIGCSHEEDDDEA